MLPVLLEAQVVLELPLVLLVAQVLEQELLPVLLVAQAPERELLPALLVAQAPVLELPPASLVEPEQTLEQELPPAPPEEPAPEYIAERERRGQIHCRLYLHCHLIFYQPNNHTLPASARSLQKLSLRRVR